MSQHNLLYYPSYVPDPGWLKTQLLFWDSIQRIVPYSMQEQYGDDYIAMRFRIDPKWAPPISPDYSDLSYFDKHKSSIERAFEQIRATDGATYEDAKSVFGVHPAKAPEWVFDTLLRLGLGKEQPEQHGEWVQNHYVVHPEAGKLILSCLASNVAHRRNFALATDQESQFYVTAANEVNGTLSDRHNSSVTGSLGLSILDALVPSSIDQMSFDDVISIRDEFYALREAFHRVVEHISDEFGLERIVDKKQAQTTLLKCVANYTEEFNRFNSVTRRAIRVVSDWRTQSFGASIGAVGTYLAGGPPEAVVLSSGAAVLALSGVLFSDKEKSDRIKSFHYIHRLNERIDPKKNLIGMRPFLHGVRLGN